MPELTWQELSEINHTIRTERVIILRAILRLQEADKKLKVFEDSLQNLTSKHAKQPDQILNQKTGD